MIKGNEEKVRNISIALFVAGIILAIINGAKVTSGTEVLLPFFLGIGTASFGLVFWQITHRRLLKKDLAKKSDAGENPFSYLANAYAAVCILLEKMQNDDISKDEICASIDTIHEENLAPFVEVRTTVLDLLGYGTGSELLINVAHGERLLNRVWSCVADDYPHEGLKALPEVKATFAAALEDIKNLT